MTTAQWIWQRLTEPSPKITERDQRRQASLLSSLLLGAIVLAILIEALIVTFIEWENYTGYRQTIAAVFLFVIIYAISRTGHVRLAAGLSVIVASLATYVSALAVPAGVQGGLLDFLLLPIWLASLYLNLRSLIALILIDLLALLSLPWLNPRETLNEILVGPFSFILGTSVLLLVLTRHRNNLELDRRAELTEKEARSRREAARAQALLRVAERLNTQLDLDTLLKAICEEVTVALNTQVALVALYDQKQAVFHSTTAVGIAPELMAGMSAFPKDLYDETVKAFGTVFGLPMCINVRLQKGDSLA